MITGLLAAGSLWLAGPTLAQEIDRKPAVDGVNASLFGGYGYAERAGATLDAGGSTVYLPSVEIGGPVVAGRLTFPIGERFGGRVLASGELRGADEGATPVSPADDSYGYLVRAGFDLFTRDPDAGFFRLGYRFRYGDPALDGANDEVTHGVSLGLGAYIPDQGLGPIDWQTSFDYAYASFEGTGFTDDVNEYSGVASSGWYWTEQLQFTAGFLWLLEDHSAAPFERTLSGSAELEWLLPFFTRQRYVAAHVGGSGGRTRSDFSAPLSATTRNVWSIGGGLSFVFPGADSLVQLKRERE